MARREFGVETTIAKDRVRPGPAGSSKPKRAGKGLCEVEKLSGVNAHEERSAANRSVYNLVSGRRCGAGNVALGGGVNRTWIGR